MKPRLPVVLALLLFLLAGCAAPGEAARTDDEAPRPSIAAAPEIAFLGETFRLKFRAAEQVMPVYEYFLAQESPQAWTQLTALRVAPPETGAPLDHAQRTAALARQQHPYARPSVYQGADTALLDFLLISDSGAMQFLEFNAFKYYYSRTGRVVSFQYAKRIPIGADSSRDALAEEIKAVRAAALAALAELPNYDL